jgi:putative addiction module antidote
MNTNTKPTTDSLQIRKIGNSVGLILPKDLLARLHLKEGDKLSIVEQTDHSFKLTPHDPVHAQAMARGLEIAKKAMKTYHNALTELAKQAHV